jgi:hypothetical protein
MNDSVSISALSRMALPGLDDGRSTVPTLSRRRIFGDFSGLVVWLRGPNADFDSCRLPVHDVTLNLQVGAKKAKREVLKQGLRPLGD